jgi:hypothetical protein
MTRVTGFVLVVLAAVLLVWALDASSSIPSGISRFFRAIPSNRAAFLYAGSVGAGVMGLGLLFAPRARSA